MSAIDLGIAKLTDGTGTFTSSPVTLAVGDNTITCTATGTCFIDLPDDCTGTATTLDGGVVTGSPLALTAGRNTVTVTDTGAGTFTVNTTAHYINGGADEAYITDATDYRTCVELMPLGVEAYRYKDYGVDYFTGDFTHYIEARLEALDTSSFSVVWMLSNAIQAGYAGGIELDQRTAVSSDDIRVKYNGSSWEHNLTAYNLFGYSSSIASGFGAGLRFADVDIPAHSTISSAKVAFKCKTGTSGTPVNAKVTGELTASADPFSDIGNYAGRRGTVVGGADDSNITSTQVSWSGIGAWTGELESAITTTPESKTVVQEIVNSEGAITHLGLFVDDHEETSSAYRHAYSADYDTDKSPRLLLTYRAPSLTVRLGGDELKITEEYNGTIYPSSAYTMTEGQIVYLKIDRSGTDFKCYIYDEPSLTTLLDTLELTLHASLDYQYHYVMNSRADSSGNTGSAWSGNLYMDDAPPKMLDVELSSFVIAPDDEDGFETIESTDFPSNRTDMPVWTTGGAGTVEHDDTEYVKDSSSAKISCSNNIAYARFTHSATPDDSFTESIYFKLESMDNGDSLQIIGVTSASDITLCGVTRTDNGGVHYYWRIWKYTSSAWSETTQTTHEVSTGVWYQVCFFEEGSARDLSLWVREIGSVTEDVWEEVGTIVGLTDDWTMVQIGTQRSNGGTSSTCVYYLDDLKYQRGYSIITKIARGGTDDSLRVIYVMKVLLSVVVVFKLYYTDLATADPDCWNYVATLGTTGSTSIAWDSNNSKFYVFRTEGTWQTDAKIVVYEVDPYDNWSTTDIGKDYTTYDEILYMIPCREMDGTEFLCAFAEGDVTDAANIDVRFIRFDTADIGGTPWKTPYPIATGGTINNYIVVEPFVWRVPAGKTQAGKLAVMTRWQEAGETEGHWATDVLQRVSYSTDALHAGESWGGITEIGGDTGLHINKCAGNLSAFLFRGNLWHEGYDSRVEHHNGSPSFKKYYSMIAKADANDGVIISQRNWFWGPLTDYGFTAGNGSVDAKDSQLQLGEYLILDVVTQQGMGWYRQVVSDARELIECGFISSAETMYQPVLPPSAQFISSAEVLYQPTVASMATVDMNFIETYIAIGSDAIDRASTLPSGFTYIDVANPSGAVASLTKVKVWSDVDLTGCKVGTFYSS